ncbi:MAG TPA: glycosyltransferase [Prolixibacteraceae bacterium]|nr:glycosyltransferase [Prolixibacteraceae bacterium]HOS90508.1 glycosyltransferase [Prolixibacteraceae bacterium]HPL45563.1 glycosyltransferase [Prolixibacteraceae bacterium]HQE52621.1 glycosyltransferase [Prolixibacteraceae bacterium]HQJ85820.1 glycosyltransferase [Prolixibacteraceae bacterium]
MMNPKGISLILCCYNSGKRLPETIKHIALQTNNDGIPWEVILVNNASTDNTEEVANKVWKTFNTSVSFTIVNEDEPGIIYARKRGLSVAKNEYIVFCDDDNWLQSDYLQYAFDSLEKFPDAGAIGGQGMVVTDGILPDWWDIWQNGYGVGKQAEKSGDITYKGYIWGAGFVSRKSVLDKVFNPAYPFILTGRKGELITSGDDAEICYRIILLGWKLYYNEDLHYMHFIPKERLTDQYKDNLQKGFESTNEIQEKYLLAIEYGLPSFFKKIYLLIKRILALFHSGFSERKIMFFKMFIFFSYGIKTFHDEVAWTIYCFMKNKKLNK